ncbi:PAS domain S-box protein [Larsenimonas rhizosphaerae]|uniref:histidine kinase n=1 Tax=Larsenimonas rhizosphaerae TaxID=2944682 RepID=A0AA41ZGD3_9GAMM|nr:response regulator [Larsenimonas rhizosphaerae]MCX2524784.1 PAS domain S-box protein [Larsenimonas rhizosphaerae]
MQANYLKLLAIDEHASTRGTLAALLDSTGLALQIHLSASLAEARQYLLHHDVDCILADHDTASVVRTDLLSILKRYQKTPYCVIVLSHDTNERIAEEALAHGAFDYLDVQELNTGQLRVALTRCRSWLEQEFRRVATENRLRSLTEGIPQLVWSCSPNGRIDYLSRQWADYTGVTFAKDLQVAWFTRIHSDDRDNFVDAWKKALEAEQDFQLLCRIRRHDGVFRWFDTRVTARKDSDGRLTQWIGSHTDITKIEEARLSQAHLAAIVENSQDAIIAHDLQGRVTSWNTSAERLFLYSAQEAIGQHLQDLTVPPHLQSQFEQHLSRLSDTGVSQPHYETLRRRRDGQYIDVAITSSLVQMVDGRVQGAAKIVRDITDRKRFSEQQLASLQEKETLLKEVYHRVKNNLQVIGSLFNMQLRQLPEGVAHDALRESADRVKAMALVHEKLYQSASLSSIDLAAYVGDLCTNLASSTGANSRDIILEPTIETIQVGLETAVPLGLLLNELLTNSLKHGFPGKKTGHVRITIDMLDDDTLKLEVIDNGVGFDDTQATGKSLGLKLIRILSRQLDGEFTTKSKNGSHSRLVFRLPAPELISGGADTSY